RICLMRCAIPTEPLAEQSTNRVWSRVKRRPNSGKISFRSWQLLSLALLSSGCCAFGACPPPSQYPTARAAIERVRSMHSCSRGLRGEAKLDYFDESGRVRVDTFYLSAHPQSLRFDLVSPFGTPLSTLTVDRDDFALLDREARVFYVGQANE